MLGLYRCALSFGSSSTLQTEVMELRGRVKVSLSVQLCGMLARVCIDTNDLRCCGLLGLELFRLKTDYMHRDAYVLS